MSWLAAVSLSVTDKLIVGTFLFPILPLVPVAGHLWIPVVKKIQEKGGKIESPGYRLLWYLSVFLVNLVLAILLAAGICLAGYVYIIGDARNNKNRSGEEYVKAIARKAKKAFWLNTEEMSDWNTGDSIIGTYAKYMTKVAQTTTAAELLGFLEG